MLNAEMSKQRLLTQEREEQLEKSLHDQKILTIGLGEKLYSLEEDQLTWATIREKLKSELQVEIADEMLKMLKEEIKQKRALKPPKRILTSRSTRPEFDGEPEWEEDDSYIAQILMYGKR